MKKSEAKLLIERAFAEQAKIFKVISVNVSNFGFNSKLRSDKVGIHIIYEFREMVPQIQITLLDNFDFDIRKGLYTLIELYKDPTYILKSFYLDEILSEMELAYKDFFDHTNTMEENLKVSLDLMEKYGHGFLNGDVSSYVKMDKWFKAKILESRQE